MKFNRLHFAMTTNGRRELESWRWNIVFVSAKIDAGYSFPGAAEDKVLESGPAVPCPIFHWRQECRNGRLSRSFLPAICCAPPSTGWRLI